jgi:16S rRNA (guanine(966)-N(2))-methyltransferase RsmD
MDRKCGKGDGDRYQGRIQSENLAGSAGDSGGWQQQITMQKRQGRKFISGHGAKGHAAHQIRIIGGQWKRTPLPVLDAQGLRPTPDRVRETLFNWLNHLLDGEWNEVACLDLFAGTGALGFEAASRGAARVLMIEENMPAVRQLEATRIKLKAEQIDIVHGNAFAIAQHMAARPDENARFHVIFLDPPYHQDWLSRMLPICEQLLVDGGFIYAESETSLDVDTPPQWLAAWNVVRADKAGMVFYHLLQRKSQRNFEA